MIPVLCFLCLTVISAQPALEDNPDNYLDVPGLITKYGYPAESHTMETEDGYLLTLHRIPHGRHPRDSRRENKVMPREPVLLQHGLLSSSASWVMGSPEHAPAYIIADAGYDVWLGNVRGNRYSRYHVRLNPDGPDGKFWDFSWDEMGQFDLPAMIDFILATTGHAQLSYIGHSMGTTIFFACMSARPEYNSKVRTMFGLAPVAFVKHIASPIRFLAPLSFNIERLLELLGKYEFLPYSRPFIKWKEKLCADSRFRELMCLNAVFLLTGFDQAQFNLTWLPPIISHHPAGTSVRTVVHFAQGVQTGNFQLFDFGKEENLKRYNQTLPPQYNLSAVTTEVNLFWSGNDYLADTQDVAHLAGDLPNLVHNVKVAMESFNHLDFLWGIDSFRLVFRLVLKYLPHL